MLGAQRVERSAALFGAVVCMAMAAVTWRGVSASQGTWPFPALYFIELMGIGAAVAAAYLASSASRAIVAWAVAGAVTAFSILGAWTVGQLFHPAAAAIVAAAVITDVRHQGRLGAHMGIFAAAALVQVVLTLAIAAFF